MVVPPVSHRSGGEIVSTFDDPSNVKLGRCDLIEEIMIGEDRMIHFSGERVCVCEGWGGRGLGEGHSVEQRAMAGKQPDWPLRRAPAAPLAP